jgi:hypothetical protein
VSFSFILSHLLKLSSIEVSVPSDDDSTDFIFWLQEDAQRLNASFDIEGLVTNDIFDFAWVRDYSISISRM